MPMPFIHVGCGKFSLQRLQVLIDGGEFMPVACVDLDIDRAKLALGSMRGAVPKDLGKRVYRTITEARERHDAEACFIYAVASAHAELVVESLTRGMHTFCVKAIACRQEEFAKVLKTHKENPNLMLMQGFNNQWNEAAAKMREWMQSDDGIGKMLGGECVAWGRQNLTSDPPQTDVTTEGMYFNGLACHQLSQLVAAKGLPQQVTAYVHRSRIEPELDFRGVWGTSGGQCLFEYPGGVPFSYTGTRAAHGNPFGFASRWSGRWTIHGEKGDLRREGGHLTLYRNGGSREDVYLKDLDSGLLEDDRIQFGAFHNALATGNQRAQLQESSLDTWILMEACNESARRNNKIDIQEFKKYLTGD